MGRGDFCDVVIESFRTREGITENYYAISAVCEWLFYTDTYHRPVYSDDQPREDLLGFVMHFLLSLRVRRST